MTRFGRMPLILGSVAMAIYPPVSQAQFDAHFSLPKPAYSLGEPVFIDFVVQNTDSEPLRIEKGAPYTVCQGYDFKTEGLRRRDQPLCSQGSAGGCSFRLDTLAPAETYQEHILLNHYFDLRKPGTYDVHATRQLSYEKVNLDPGVPSPPPHAEFEAYFTITIDEYGTADLPAVFEPFVRDLQSSDLKQKLEAAEVIADLAPPFLERTLLEMLNSTPDLLHYGVQGLRTLATPNAHQALAEFVKNAPPTDSFGPYQEAIRALGEIGNAGDVDMLLAVAKANTPVGPSRALAIEAAGAAGGDSAVGPLATDLSQEWGEARVAVARGLSLTGSRSAVPTLIDLLRSPQKEVREAAEFGLHALTRHDAGSTGAPASAGGAYDAWNQWWHNHAATARIFKPKSCAAAPAP